MDKYLIDGHKLYWHLDRVLEWQEKKDIAPVYIEVSPVGFCNHHCIFCGIDFAMSPKKQLDTGILCKRLSEMGSMGVKSIMFAGEGEPLLHKDITSLIKVARESGMDVSITTNGSVGNSSLWQSILPDLAWIRFSMDAGTPEVYARVHGVAELSFGRTIENIKNAVKVKKENSLRVTIGIQYVILEENIRDIENAINLFSETGIDYLSLKPFSLHPKMINKMDVTYTEEINKHIEGIVHSYKEKVGMDIIFRKEGLEKYKKGEKGFGHCYALPFWGYISSAGDFYTCSVFIGDERFRTGNIYKEDMPVILMGNRRRDSIRYGIEEVHIGNECRTNCRMARINEFLECLHNEPEHVNFI